MQLAVEVEVKEENISCRVFLLKETGYFNLKTAWQKTKSILANEGKNCKIFKYVDFFFYEIIVIIVFYETEINEKTHSIPTKVTKVKLSYLFTSSLLFL